jgi:hypothetical protein
MLVLQPPFEATNMKEEDYPILADLKKGQLRENTRYGISKQISYRNCPRYPRTCLVAIKANEVGVDAGSKHGWSHGLCLSYPGTASYARHMQWLRVT